MKWFAAAASSIKEKFYFSFNYGIKGYSFLAQLTTSLFSLQSIFNFIYSHSIPYLFSFLACPIGEAKDKRGIGLIKAREMKWS